MKALRFSCARFIAILKQAKTDALVPELCRERGISTTAFYTWRTQLDGMDASPVARLKELVDLTP